jgi:aminoglycoside phosphotransferase (APT) family kinase protein
MENSILIDIPQYKSWRKIEKINYGWSDDIKLYIEDLKGTKFLLRISNIEKLEDKKKEFYIIQKYNQLNFIMSQAIDIGVCNKGQNVYMLLSWVEGLSMENVIKTLSEQEQYQLGIKAGKVLQAIHSLAVEPADFPKVKKTNKKFIQLQRYENSKYRIPNDEKVIDYIKENIDLMCQSEPVYEHGDFHIGNMVYTTGKDVGVIDFNRWECGDRYEEFYKLQSFDVDLSIAFSIGQLHGYFDGEPTLDFWRIQAVYVAHSALFSIEWAVKFGEDDIANMTRICHNTFRDYDNFKLLIPKWYSENKEKFLSS